MKLKPSDVKHLRRLLGYVHCEIMQSPDEFKQTLRKIASTCGAPDAAAQRRLVETYLKAESVPQYVRAAIKALEKLLADASGDIIQGRKSDLSLPSYKDVMGILRPAQPIDAEGQEKQPCE